MGVCECKSGMQAVTEDRRILVEVAAATACVADGIHKLVSSYVGISIMKWREMREEDSIEFDEVPQEILGNSWREGDVVAAFCSTWHVSSTWRPPTIDLFRHRPSHRSA